MYLFCEKKIFGVIKTLIPSTRQQQRLHCRQGAVHGVSLYTHSYVVYSGTLCVMHVKIIANERVFCVCIKEFYYIQL